jgi:hypothetical protein
VDKGEMGGLWLHPIKLIDGFWVRLSDTSTGKERWLTEAIEFINYPYGNRFKYAGVLDGIRTERRDYMSTLAHVEHVFVRICVPTHCNVHTTIG